MTEVDYPEGFETIYSPADWRKDRENRWWIGTCPHCCEPMLILNSGDRIYPRPFLSATDERIPDGIRLDLDEAKLCLVAGAYNAAVIMARRALEVACKEKGSTKSKLIDQVDELYRSGTITGSYPKVVGSGSGRFPHA